MSFKRQRSPSESEDSDDEDDLHRLPSSPALKAFRPNEPVDGVWKCSLPPTCNRDPRTFATSEAYEAHWNTFHSFVCEAESLTQPGERCGRIFPDARYTHLHQRECHDAIVAMKREAGERTYECFLQPEVCNKKFRTVKGRRLHLITKHGYPEEFFFAIVLYGIEQAARKGQGLLRKEWPRSREASKSTSPDPQPPMKLGSKANSDVDDLAASLESSISLVPRSVRLKEKAKESSMQQ